MKEIQLTKGKVALVSDEWYDKLNKYKWQAQKGGERWYAVRNGSWIFGNRVHVKMHRVIANTPKGMDTDHINGNGLDNRPENLRICSRSENAMNTRTRSTNTSGYKGVSWDKINKKWRARLKVNWQDKSLGGFHTAEAAARAYDEAAKKYHGEFAVLNFPEEKS